jgi:hypothetical protein
MHWNIYLCGCIKQADFHYYDQDIVMIHIFTYVKSHEIQILGSNLELDI